jgi:hypothetical protein
MLHMVHHKEYGINQIPVRLILGPWTVWPVLVSKYLAYEFLKLVHFC